MRNSGAKGANYFFRRKTRVNGFDRFHGFVKKSAGRAHTRFRSCPHFSHSGKIRSLDWLVAFHRLSRKNCAPADIELVTTKEAPETAGLAQSVQFVEPRLVELCNVQPE
jgi:hypothetical protein